MNEQISPAELIAQAATKYDVQPELLKELLELEATFTNFTAYGAKADFARQVARLLDKAADQGDL